mmetsp:Transcript_129966/g.228885  ORF Transcript_129966/g.228885 Transcript_129966/m.228885 type:complete len:711 (-) Transcript_129966:77-2209(-)
MFSCTRSMLALLLSLVFLRQAMSSVHADVSPVDKVVQLLTELKAKITREGEEEKKLFEAFMAWCKDGGKEKEFEIKTGKSKIQDLEATISKGASDFDVSSSKIEELAAQLSTNDADLKAATTIRDKAHKEFVALEKELMDTLDTLERAINILERKMRGSALMQAKVDSADIKHLVSTLSAVIDAAALSLHDRTKLLGLVQSSDDEEDAAFGAPSPEAYKGHSEGIVDVLEDLKQKAAAQLEQARREEVSDKHNFDLLEQSLSDQMKADQADLASNKQLKHEATESVAAAQGDLEEEKKALAEAETTLKNMDGDCKQRAADNEVTVAKRAEELEAVEKARQVIQESTGGAAKLVYDASFLQVDTVDGNENTMGSHLKTHADLANFEVVNLLRKLAHEQQSVALQQLATRISTAMKNSATTGEDPFAKVKGMISDMIEKLLKDAGEEAQHKAYCDKEMAETKQKTDELEYDVEKYSSKLDKARAASVMLKDEVSVLQNEILEITKSQSEADDLRKEELKVYTQSKSDLEQGIEGVRLAMKMLRDFYAEQPAAMIQQPARADAAGGIVAMLEVVEADMGKSLATIEMNEETAATQYERTKMQNKIDKKMKESDVKYKTKEAATLDKKATDLASDLDSTQAELDAVLSYTKNIRGMCSTKPEGYEERKVRREQEIEGLKEALRILEGEAVFLQGRSKSSRLRGIMASARPHAQQ